MTKTVLRIDASARHTGSESRALTQRIVDRLAPTTVITRHLAVAVPAIDGDWLNANWTPEDQRTDTQRETLALSDTLIAELKAADTIVIGAPIYDFGIPATLKTWVDLIARAGITFKYSESGPQGLLTANAPLWRSRPAAHRSGPRSILPAAICAMFWALSASQMSSSSRRTS